MGSFYRNYGKRIIDFISSFAGLIVLSPLLLVVALLVRFKLGSPVLFVQERPGRDKKTFKLYKFRTMTDEVDESGELLPDSIRLTKFGNILRLTSLDELPELLNILIGDMSIVGPRPLLKKYLPYYTSEEKLRHTVRPGLTGLSQINGRNNLNWDRRLALDKEYVLTYSLKLDLIILVKTVWKVISKSDVIVVDQGEIKDLDVERKNERND